MPPEILALLPPDEAAEIDVQAFLDALQAHARENPSPDVLYVLGRLARAAWARLRHETANLLQRATDTPAPPPDEPDPWGAFLETDFARGIDQEARTHELLMRAGPRVLQPALRRVGTRPVTLMELVDALEEAYAEAAVVRERQRALEERRRRAREARERVPTFIHGEDHDADVAHVLAHLPAEGEIALPELARSAAPYDRVGALQAVLTLAKRGVVRLRQDRFPHSPVLVERVAASGG